MSTLPSRPKEDGRHAFIDKLPITANPHKPGSVSWSFWRAAWLKEQKSDKRFWRS